MHEGLNLACLYPVTWRPAFTHGYLFQFHQAFAVHGKLLGHSKIIGDTQSATN